jgi:hypothetical protein
MDPKELVTVYTVGNPVEAEIVKNALVAEGIPAFVENELQAGEAGLTGIEIEILVAAENADRARKFIKAHEHRHKHGHHPRPAPEA